MPAAAGEPIASGCQHQNYGSAGRWYNTHSLTPTA
jgi:hypothetical protein